MKEFTVRENDAGLRLDKFVSKAVPSLPQSLIQKYIRLKRIKINSSRAKPDTRLSLGDTVEMYLNDGVFEEKKRKPINNTRTPSAPKIIYEDENIILADKPPGVSVHDDDAGGETLISQILFHLKQSGEWSPERENTFVPALCNRIDRNTGGIVIAAKNAEALRIMNEKIKKRELTKLYLCIVLGTPSPRSGTLKGYIFKDARENRVYVRKSPSPGAKSAVTRYRTLETRSGISLVECELITGRTHQIRAQMAAAGYPLLGDGKYGINNENKKYGVKTQALYSYKLTFDFKTPSGILSYLDKKTFAVENVPFREKFF